MSTDKISFHELKKFLLSEIEENYQNVELYIRANGDHIEDLVLEACTKNNRIRFRPYELWKCDDPKMEIVKLLEKVK